MEFPIFSISCITVLRQPIGRRPIYVNVTLKAVNYANSAIDFWKSCLDGYFYIGSCLRKEVHSFEYPN